MNHQSVRERLIAHLAGDGTLNDNTVDELYREANRIPADQETDLETVERWAVSVAGTHSELLSEQEAAKRFGALTEKQRSERIYGFRAAPR
jgi:hypothetical protein